MLAIVAASIVGGVTSGGGSSPARGAGPSSSSIPSAASPAATSPSAASPAPTTADAKPTAAGVAAARACEAFEVYVEAASKGTIPKAVGTRLADAAGALLKGARADQSAGRALPKWAPLGSDRLAAADDIVDGKATALKTDGTAADTACATLSAAAARAGGYKRTG